MAIFFINVQGRGGLAPSDRAPWEESTDHHTGLPVPEQFYTWTQGIAYGGLISAATLERAFGESTLADRFRDRASEIQSAVIKYLWDDQNGYLYRGRTADTFTPDTRAESATLSAVFTGLLDRTSSSMHLKFINAALSHLGTGVARYAQDPYFFDSIWNPCGNGTRETQMWEPSWPVTTAYAAWAEDVLGLGYQSRLDWMVRFSAFGNMPTGEAVDSADGALVVPSAPDGFEHGGVYCLTVLIQQKLALSIYAAINQ
jgi:GH15 family glucan-1,4-alpha-glucosidase